MLPCTSDPFY